MKYSDFVSFLIIIMMIPSMTIKLSVNLIPISIAVLCAKHNKDKLSNLCLTFNRKYSNLHNNVERKISHGLSLVLSPISSYKRYKKNKKIIKFIKDHVNRLDDDLIKYEKLPSNIRYAIQKEGGWEVWFQMLVMFSILPTIKHTFMNNPFLFDYQLYLTNQSSEEFTNQEKMCHLLFSYINDPAFIFKFDPDKKIDQISFTPNYYNDPTDNIVDNNQIGLQISTYFSTLIYLDTLNKNGASLYQDIIDRNYDQTIMHQTHPIYQEIESSEIQLFNNVGFDSEQRVKLLDLILPYDHHYHIITGFVEANIAGNNKIEHPMLCLYHQGSVMVKFWNSINDMFENDVMVYLKSLENIEETKS